MTVRERGQAPATGLGMTWGGNGRAGGKGARKEDMDRQAGPGPGQGALWAGTGKGAAWGQGLPHGAPCSFLIWTIGSSKSPSSSLKQTCKGTKITASTYQSRSTNTSSISRTPSCDPGNLRTNLSWRKPTCRGTVALRGLPKIPTSGQNPPHRRWGLSHATAAQGIVTHPFTPLPSQQAPGLVFSRLCPLHRDPPSLFQPPWLAEHNGPGQGGGAGAKCEGKKLEHRLGRRRPPGPAGGKAGETPAIRVGKLSLHAIGQQRSRDPWGESRAHLTWPQGQEQ